MPSWNGGAAKKAIIDFVGRVTAAGWPDRRSSALLIHHTDGDREFSYDKHADKVLERAGRENWTVVDMKRDWRRVFSFEKP